MGIETKINEIINHIIDIKEEQARQGEKIDQNTEDLRTHIEGVKQNRIRIENLEKINERKKGAVKLLVTLSGIIAGIGAVMSAIYKYLI